MMPKRRQRTAAPLTLALVALLCALILAAAVFRAPLSSILWRALTPVMVLRESLGSSEVTQLTLELASTSAALADHDRLAAENALLRAELGRNDATRPRVLAGILMRPPGTPYDTLVVDAGAAEGVGVGDRARAGALAIGVVDEVYPNSARVVLYSAPGQSYDAVLEASSTQTAVPLVVEGQGAGSFSARVPSGTVVHSGDPISFPGLKGGMVGVVSAVAGVDTDTFKTVYLRLPVDLFSLRYVYIEK